MVEKNSWFIYVKAVIIPEHKQDTHIPLNQVMFHPRGVMPIFSLLWGHSSTITCCILRFAGNLRNVQWHPCNNHGPIIDYNLFLILCADFCFPSIGLYSKQSRFILTVIVFLLVCIRRQFRSWAVWDTCPTCRPSVITVTPASQRSTREPARFNVWWSQDECSRNILRKQLDRYSMNWSIMTMMTKKCHKSE